MANFFIDGYTNIKPHFYKEAISIKRLFNTTDVSITDGVVRWTSNNQIPPKDILEFWNYLNFEFDYNKTLLVKEVEETEFLENYKKYRKPLYEEEQYELEAAFGKGKTVVNIITGKKYRT